VTGVLRRILASSRYFVVVAVVGSFVASAALVYGGLATVRVVLDAFGSGDYSEKGAKLLSVGLVTIRWGCCWR
jgi:hypothetical protein